MDSPANSAPPSDVVERAKVAVDHRVYGITINATWMLAKAICKLPLEEMLARQLDAATLMRVENPMLYASAGVALELDIMMTRALLAARVELVSHSHVCRQIPQHWPDLRRPIDIFRG